MTDRTTDVRNIASAGFSRRTLMKTGIGAIAAPAVLRVIPANAQSKIIKIGYVNPRTGPLAGFGEADNFIIDQVKGAMGDGLKIGGKTYPVQIIAKDSQSTGTRAAGVASELILGDKVDILLASSAPDTTNPVADQAEVNEVPCITTVCPWQPYFFGRSGDPNKGFTWTYHFFWGLEDAIAVFLALWDGAPTNKAVAGLFPNDADGNAWGDPKLGLPPALSTAGYKLVDPGRYQLFNNDFSSQISAYKAAGCEIVTGNMIPPDFATFWSQAAQQGFRPKIVTIGKALLFPSVLESLGPRGDRLSTEIGGHRTIPSSPASPDRVRSSSPMPTRPPPSGPGPSRSASCMPCSRSRLMFLSGQRQSTPSRFSMRSLRQITSRSWVPCIGADNQ